MLSDEVAAVLIAAEGPLSLDEVTRRVGTRNPWWQPLRRSDVLDSLYELMDAGKSGWKRYREWSWVGPVPLMYEI